MAQRDVVLRWIEQLGRVIARLMRGGTAGDFDLARDQLDEASASLLGPLVQLVPRLDVSSAAELIREPDRIFAWAQLMDLGAAIDAAQGAVETAALGRARAVAAAREAARRMEDVPADLAEWIAARDGGAPSSSTGT